MRPTEGRARFMSVKEKWLMRTSKLESGELGYTHVGRKFSEAGQMAAPGRKFLTSQKLSDSFILQFEEIYKWPASIDLALLHEKANSLGLEINIANK
jgi:hypothetical protein